MTWTEKLEKRLPFLFTPHGIMRAVVAMYSCKVLSKVVVGGLIAGSMVVMADGMHNISDIGEALLVIFAVTFALKTSDGKYPFGRRNIESFAMLTIGFSLIVLATNIGLSSAHGLERTFDCFSFLKALPADSAFVPKDSKVSEWYWLLACVMSFSIALSFVVGTIQIYVGKKFARPVIASDGYETHSDGVIESIALVSITGEYFFSAPWLEYVLGPLAALYLCKTGFELIASGWRTLLQRSIGKDHEKAIIEIAKNMRGVISVAEIKTFMLGGMAMVIMKLVTRCSGKTDRSIKKVLAEKIGKYLKEANFHDFDWYIRFETPSPSYYRIAYAIVGPDALGPAVLAPTLADAHFYRIVDIGDGAPVRYRDWPKKIDTESAVAFLSQKRVQEIVSYDDESDTCVNQLKAAGIKHTTATTPYLMELGVP